MSVFCLRNNCRAQYFGSGWWRGHVRQSFSHAKTAIGGTCEKKDGSARNVAECVEAIALGEREVSAEGSCITLVMSCYRPSKVDGAKKSTFSGISSFNHFKFEHSEEDFIGMRVLAHADIGPGKFYSAQVCKDMWTEDGGLSVELCDELKEAASILRERNTAGAYTCTYVHVF